MRVFRENNAEEALHMLRGDEDAVQCEVRIIQEIMEGLSNPESSLEPYQAMHIILVARSLTRVWRRSINIAEQVYFINQGESLKHKGEERSEEARLSSRSATASFAGARLATAKAASAAQQPVASSATSEGCASDTESKKQDG